MKIFKIELSSPINIEDINLAIGNFDGIHIGHQKLIKKLVSQSKEKKIDPTVMSFTPHPRQFFTKKFENFNIISENLKVKLLDEMGVKNYILFKFDKNIAALSPEEFIDRILNKKFKIKNLLVGLDFKFGQNRKGDVNLLKEKSSIYNFNVSILDQIKLKKTSEIFSSTLIRNNIQNGNFEKVNSCLGRNWSIEGIVISGDKRARKMNFPTANIIPPKLVYPKKGVYIVEVFFEKNKYKAIANFGVRPTVDGEKLLLEIHIFDFNSDLYGKYLTVEFLTFIRGERKFANFEELKQQINKDILIAKNYHANK